MVDEDIEKQEPEKPKKKSGGIGMVKLIIIIFAVILVQGILFFVLFKFVLAPALNPTNLSDKEKQELLKKQEEEKKKEEHKENEEEAHMAPEKEIHYAKTGRITTNPKGSDRFVVVNLGIEFRAKGELEGASKESPLPEKLSGRIQGVITGVLGSLSVEELQHKRDSLPEIFKTKLKPVVQSQKEVFLRSVDVLEFILQ